MLVLIFGKLNYIQREMKILLGLAQIKFKLTRGPRFDR